MREAKIKLQSSGQEYSLHDGMTIGRSETCDVVVQENAVSRVHAVIAQDGDGWFITDNNSTNGVIVNGVKAVPGQKTELTDGAALQLGSARLIVEMEPIPVGEAETAFLMPDLDEGTAPVSNAPFVAPVMPQQPSVPPMQQNVPPMQQRPVQQSVPPMQQRPVQQNVPPMHQQRPVQPSVPPMQQRPVQQSVPPMQQRPVQQNVPPMQQRPMQQPQYQAAPQYQAPNPIPQTPPAAGKPGKKKLNPLIWILPAAGTALLLTIVIIVVAVVLSFRVTDIMFSKASIAIERGETVALSYTVEPEKASSRVLNWESSDESVASVDESGSVTAHKVGRCEITASADDVSDTIKIEVYKVEASLSASSLELRVGETAAVWLTITPSDVAASEFTWKSTDPSVATVDQNGTITAVGDGICSITATRKDYAVSVTVSAFSLTEEEACVVGDWILNAAYFGDEYEPASALKTVTCTITEDYRGVIEIEDADPDPFTWRFDMESGTDATFYIYAYEFDDETFERSMYYFPATTDTDTLVIEVDSTRLFFERVE